MNEFNMAVLLSGSGRTLDNFHDKICRGEMAGKIALVVTNVKDALGLEKARKYGYPAYHAGANEDINHLLREHGVDLVLLAGFLQLYRPPEFLKRRVLNIHPSLIPSFCGKGYYGHHVHEAVKARGCKVSGCTVHFANEVYDEGPIVVQQCVALADDDLVADIADKVFAAECEAYPRAVNLVAEKGVDYFWHGA